ncbi:hypothetical protein GJ496_002403 [Pomphorhynchus laevis]|nr:hypothetical protein GJ496_002403 [Pomphorhynchus laevis]
MDILHVHIDNVGIPTETFNNNEIDNVSNCRKKLLTFNILVKFYSNIMTDSPPRSPSRKAVRLSVTSEQDASQERVPGPGDSEHQRQSSRKQKREFRLSELQEAFLKLNIFPEYSSTDDVGSKDGQSIELLTNFFEIETLPKFIVHEYAVEFEPECVRRKSCLQMLNQLVKSGFLGLFAFDGKQMYVVHKIKSEEAGEDDEMLNKECLFKDKKYIITFKHTNIVAPNTLPYVQLLGILFRHKLYRLGMRTINRNLYEMGNEHRVEEQGIYLFPGVKTSILPRGKNNNLLLCVDKLHKILNSSTLEEYMYSFERWDQHDKDEVRRFLVGQSVVTRYNMNSYRIDDVDFDKSIKSTFNQGGRQVSYEDYYKEHYNETLKCHDLPLLAVRSRRVDGSRDTIYLVPELCHLAGVNTGLGGNMNIMRSLSKHCGPSNRISYITGIVKRVQEQVSEQQRSTGLHWGLNINSRPKVIKGRILPQLTPMMDGGRSTRTWPQVCLSPMLRSLSLDNWIVLHSRGTDAHSLVNGIWDTLSKLGIEPKQPTIHMMDNESVRGTHEMLQRLRNRNELDSNQLVLFVQQDRSLDRNYKEIKKVMGQHFGLISQFVKGRNCRTKSSVYQKIALQIGCKIGGEPWAMQIPFKKPTMILGIDCHHSSGSQTIAACVATMNRLCSKFYSRCTVQQEGQEMLSAIGGFVSDAFEQFRERNKGRYPDQFVVYRDGVGDGQLAVVRDYEVTQISQIARLRNPNCTVTFIVVKKRGITRLFVQQGHDGLNNPPAGTIVDDVITHSGWRDFYMIPQKVTQGTATPSHYNIILDESGFSDDFVQDMTYKLCHMYFNWTGPIRVPSVCQYAHKLAFLVGTCMSSEPSEQSMYSKLYYL